ncbi:MAG TPA: glycosyltransferase family 39 protein [Chloroflexia bacterium]|nr:glycosyltransferase family 39 protein [Chloroflexia bacterium]
MLGFNWSRVIIEQQAEQRGQVTTEALNNEPGGNRLRRNPGWLEKVQTPFFGWLLGLLGAGAYLAWLSLPSRLPALALLVVLLTGVGLRWYAGRRIAGLALQVKAEYVALAFILVGAGLLRFVGLHQALPYFDNPDEPTLTNAAIKMLQSGDLNPHFFRWPSLPFYLQLAVSVPQFLSGVGKGLYTGLNNIAPEDFFLAGRTLVACLGLATVFVTYLLGRKLYSPAIGLLAALIIAALPLHSEHSHYVTPDVTVTFFCTLTLLLAAYIYASGERRWYLWAGVAAGLTIGSKYNVGIVILSVALAHFLTPKERRGQLRWLGWSFGLALLTFLVTTPFAILDLTGFLNELAFQIRHYTIIGHGSASEGASWSAYALDFWQEGFVYQASLVALGGVVLALVRQRREDWLLVSFPVAAYLFFSTAKVHFSRNLLPLLPPLAVLSAIFLLFLAGWLLRFAPSNWSLALTGRVKTGLVLVLWLGFFSIALLYSVLTTRYFLQPDTRQEAASWIVTNVPAGAKVRIEQGGPILPPGRYQNADEQRPIGAHPPTWFKEQGFTYLVASSLTYTDLMQTDAQASANYQKVFQDFTLVQEFKEASKEHPGPTIRIYKVR